MNRNSIFGSMSLLGLCRLIVVIYFFSILVQIVPCDYAFAAVPLYALSAVFSIVILEMETYDLRSSVTFLVVVCNLYFGGRPSFAFQKLGLAYLLGLFSYDLFLAGIILSLGIIKRHPKPVLAVRQIRKPLVFIFFTVLMLIVYMVILIYILRITGALEAMDNIQDLIFRSLTTREAITNLGLSPLLQSSYLVSALGMAASFVLWNSYRSRTFLVCWIVAVACGALTLGSRGSIVIPVIQLVLASSVLALRPRRILVTLFLPLVVSIYIFSIWFSAARAGATASNDNYSILERFDAYDNWMQSVSDKGIAYAPGASFSDAVFQFVPRSVYPEKPYYFSSKMTQLYHPEASDLGVNYDYGGIAESIYNFGMIGPLFFGIFLGWISFFVERYRREAMINRSPLSAYIYSQGALIPASFFFIGWINSSMIFAVIGLILIALFMRCFDLPIHETKEKK